MSSRSSFGISLKVAMTEGWKFQVTGGSGFEVEQGVPSIEEYRGTEK